MKKAGDCVSIFLKCAMSVPQQIKKNATISRKWRFNWWPLCESNTVPTDYESAALTKHELRGRILAEPKQ